MRSGPREVPCSMDRSRARARIRPWPGTCFVRPVSPIGDSAVSEPPVFADPDAYTKVRRTTLALTEALAIEDLGVQAMADASPSKWHLAHTTWFFSTFVLEPFWPDVHPALSIRPGQVQRWRIVNASTARFYELSLAGHALHVVGTDGGLLDKPYAQSAVLLAPGASALARRGTRRPRAASIVTRRRPQSERVIVIALRLSGGWPAPRRARRGAPCRTGGCSFPSGSSRWWRA